jgi:predicted metalloprotease with PDZ domain
MKSILRMIGCITIMLFLSTGTLLSATCKLSDGMQKKERAKIFGWIGIMIQNVNKKIARKAKLDSEEGAYVKEVVEDSPADSAGILEGDVIVQYNKKNLFDADDLIKVVHRTLPGTKANLVIVRAGVKKTIDLIVGTKKGMKHRMFGTEVHIPDVRVVVGSRILGLQLLTLNDQLGEYFGAPNNEGVLVAEVESTSNADKAGFKAGDIIIRVAQKTVTAIEKLLKELRGCDDGDQVEFEIIRKGEKKMLRVKMEEEQVIQRNFFFPKPQIQMFQTDPFDDEEKYLEMDEFRPDLDQEHTELEQPMNDFKGQHRKTQKQV